MTDAVSRAVRQAGRTAGRVGEASSGGPTEVSQRAARHGRAVQVFARDVRLPLDAPLVRLHLGQADALRADARAGHLICPIADCEDPRLTTRAGSRRDHFAHLHRAGAAHGAETIAHHTAKHLLAAWLRERWPEALVHCDDRDVEDGQRPDVLLELPELPGHPEHPAGPLVQAPEPPPRAARPAADARSPTRSSSPP